LAFPGPKNGKGIDTERGRLEITEEPVLSSHRQRACDFERGEDAFYTYLTATRVNEAGCYALPWYPFPTFGAQGAYPFLDARLPI
jgi:hypothetical protein